MRPAWFVIALGGVFALVSYWLPGVAFLAVLVLLTALTLLWFQRRAEVRMDREMDAEMMVEHAHWNDVRRAADDRADKAEARQARTVFALAEQGKRTLAACDLYDQERESADASVAHLAAQWAATIKPTTAGNRAREWMDDRDPRSPIVVAEMLRRAEGAS